jgi:hypothetical protein
MPSGSGQDFNFARAEALTKYLYASKVEELAPESDKIAKEFEFVDAAQKLGRKFYMPVEPARSMGATHNSDGSAFTLNKSRAPSELTAEILGTELLLRETMSYAIMQRALSGDPGTKAGLKAFVQATSSTFKRLSKGGSYFRECDLLYGAGASPDATSKGLGIVLNTTGSSGTSLVIQMSAADWATAIWSGSENGAFDIYSTAGTKRNSSGSNETSVYVLASVDSVNYKLTFTSDATNVSNVVATDVIFFEGARSTTNLGIMEAATTTTLWGISTSTWNLWKPQTVAIGGMATFESIMEGTAKVADIGFMGTLNVHVSPATWKDINDDQTALARWTNKGGGKVTAGFEEIEYVGQTGTVRIKSNIYMKRGYAIGLPEGYCKRVGSTDLTFTMPGYGKMLRELENTAGVEARIYSDQAPFVERPAFMVNFTGISNSSD